MRQNFPEIMLLLDVSILIILYKLSDFPNSGTTCPCKVYSFDLQFCETGVHMGIHIFSIFDSKHRLWVVVRTASPPKRGGFNVYTQSIF